MLGGHALVTTIHLYITLFLCILLHSAIASSCTSPPLMPCGNGRIQKWRFLVAYLDVTGRSGNRDIDDN